MTKLDDHTPPLPDGLQKAAAELRRAQLPEGFDARLNDALVAADEAGWRTARPRASRWSRLGGGWLAVVPGAAGMALMLHMAVGDGTEEGADEMWHQVQAQELELVLQDAGHSWISLDLLTHHHEGADAVVRVEAPHDVKVVASEHAEAHDDSPVCKAKRCVHSFSQSTHRDVSRPLQLGVSTPGRYRISVEHASSTRRVREEFVVHARR
jgi:hypothetical protein